MCGICGFTVDVNREPHLRFMVGEPDKDKHWRVEYAHTQCYVKHPVWNPAEEAPLEHQP